MYRPLQLKILLFFVWCFSVSCGPATPQTSTPVTDKELNAAIDEANKTRGYPVQGHAGAKAIV